MSDLHVHRPEKVGDLVLVDAEAQQEHAATAQALLDALLDTPLHGPELPTAVARLCRLGDEPMRQVGDAAGRILRRPAAALSGSGAGAAARAGTTLAAPGQLRTVVHALLAEQDDLRRENAAIRTEHDALWHAMVRLAEAAVLVRHLCDGLERHVAALRSQGRRDDAATLESDALFPVRRRHQDLTTQMAVAVQGYLALDVAGTTNIELIEAVDRALDAATAHVGRS